MSVCEALRLNDVTARPDRAKLVCPRLAECSIHRHPLFADLADEDLAALCQNSRRQSFASGESICQAGEAAERFYIVLSGSVRLFHLTDRGHERVVGHVGPDEVLGELAACSPEGLWPWDAQCIRRTEVRAFSGNQLRQLVSQRSDYVLNMMRYVAAAFSSQAQDQAVMAIPNARERLAQYLLRLIPGDDHRNGGIPIELPVPKGVLASQLAMQPETLSRMLRSLCDQQLLSIRHRRITVLDRRGLQALVG